jgi:ribosomal protein S18 acetylase RimI-like enzyme
MIFDSIHPDIPDSNVSKLDQLYLLDAFHGLKLGARLLQFNIDLSKANGQTGMWLIVWVGNRKAISFYEKFGFRIIGEGDFRLTDLHVSRYYLMFLSYNIKN